MDREAFQLGYLMGRALSLIDAAGMTGATRGLEAAVTRILAVDRVVRAELENVQREELEWFEQLFHRPWPYLFPEYGRLWTLLVVIPRNAERAYEDAVQHAATIHGAMEQSGLHDVVAHVAEVQPEAYGREREWPPPDVHRLAESLGTSVEEAIELVGGKLTPQEAIAEVRQTGSRNIFARLLSTPNPFTAFLSRVMSFRRGTTPEILRRWWPIKEGWGPALGGVVLVGADIVSAVEGLVGGSSLGGVAAAIQAVYSVPEGCARIQRGVERIRAQTKRR